MTDFSIFYKEALSVDMLWTTQHKWDLFISFYNSSPRVKRVFQRIRAARKLWVVHEEYGYRRNEYPHGEVFATPKLTDEAEFITKLFEQIGDCASYNRICLDITGSMRPHLMVLLLYLSNLGIKSFDVLYTEPVRYRQKERTVFADESNLEVRHIAGFEGVHNATSGDDLLVIGTGYDHALMAQVSENKERAKKVQIFGFPSLVADMYQENVLRVHRASESIGTSPWEDPDNCYFAPANDPFITANVVREIVSKKRESERIENVYLCPTGTKVQVLGFALYYISECKGTATSMIFPFSKAYSQETTTGLTRIWKYTVEF
jgi:hypothetical protein